MKFDLVLFLKKLIRYFVYLLIFIISPIIILFILFLKRIKIVRVFSIDSQRIGHFATNVDNYINKLNNENKRQYFDFCFYQSFVSNTFLGKLWKRKIDVYPNLFLFPIYTILKLLSKKCSIFKTHLIYHSPGQERDLDNFCDTKPSNLIFNKSEINFGKNLVKDFGLDEDDKFVCLTVRDSHYLQQTFPKDDFTRWNYRDYDINLFKLACDEITKHGYYVFRMGKLAEKKLKFHNKMVIDYAFSPIKSDFLDIFLLSNCEFCLTTDLGLDSIPLIARRPIASITDPISLMKLSSKKFLNIFSYYYYEKEKRYLNLNEIFKFNLAFFDSSKDFEGSGVRLIKPDENDIKHLALDMIEYSKNNFKFKKQELKLNKDFLNIYNKLCISHKFIETFNNHINHKNKDNINKLHNILYGGISPTFLKKNSHLINIKN